MKTVIRSDSYGTKANRKTTHPLEGTLGIVFDVMAALGWGGPLRVLDVEVHIHSVPRGGGWKDGIVTVRHIEENGSVGDECKAIALTREQVLTEVGAIIDFVGEKGWRSVDELAVARRLVQRWLAPAGSERLNR